MEILRGSEPTLEGRRPEFLCYWLYNEYPRQEHTAHCVVVSCFSVNVRLERGDQTTSGSSGLGWFFRWFRLYASRAWAARVSPSRRAFLIVSPRP